jgi:peptidoglycan/LPS O-acetylase OafA/YrhL
MVFGDHLQFFDFGQYPAFKEWHYQIIGEGFIGVSFFFILSGFILSLNYDEKLLTRKVTFREFWVARIARVYPLHLFTLLLAVLLGISATETISDFFIDPAPSVVTFLSNATLIQSFIPDAAYFFSYNTPSWSISDEMFFYFAFPFVVLLFVRNKVLLRFGLLLFLCVPAIMYFWPNENHHKFFYINPFFRIVDFLIGIFLHQLYKVPAISRLFRSKISATFLELLAIGAFVVVFAYHNYVPVLYRYSCYYWVPMSLIIFCFAYQAGAVSRMLSGRVLVLLGEISFSFYLIHQLVIRFMVDKNAEYGLTGDNYVLTAIIFVISLGLSYVLHRFVEKPCNTYLKAQYRNSTFFHPEKVLVA